MGKPRGPGHLEQTWAAEYLDTLAVSSSSMCSYLLVHLSRFPQGQAEAIYGDTSLNQPGFLNMSLRQPYGVVAGIIRECILQSLILTLNYCRFLFTAWNLGSPMWLWKV